MASKLKKCPFCGGKAIKSNDKSYVECTKCGVKIDYFACGKGDAIAAWNRRVEPTLTKEELEALLVTLRTFAKDYDRNFSPMGRSVIAKCEAALKGGE